MAMTNDERAQPEIERVTVCLDARHPEPCFCGDDCEACKTDGCDAAAVIEGRFTLDGDALSIRTFLDVNRGDFEADDYWRIAALTPGETLSFGGGAAAEFVLRREA
jgi:hypothetical protein